METLTRDPAACILSFLDFTEGCRLARVSRLWRNYCESEQCWKNWFEELFGIYSINGWKPPSWKAYFRIFWTCRQKAYQKMKSPPTRFAFSFYYRAPNKPCIFVKGCFEGLHLETGDLLLSSDQINEKNNSEFPNWGISCFHQDKGINNGFYQDRDRGIMGLSYSRSMKGSVPHIFSFPEFPLDFYYQTFIPCFVHIRMAPSDRAKLVFELAPEGHIAWYQDPRIPGLKIYITGPDHPLTLKTFDQFIDGELLHVELYNISDLSCSFVAIRAPK